MCNRVQLHGSKGRETHALITGNSFGVACCNGTPYACYSQRASPPLNKHTQQQSTTSGLHRVPDSHSPGYARVCTPASRSTAVARFFISVYDDPHTASEAPANRSTAASPGAPQPQHLRRQPAGSMANAILPRYRAQAFAICGQ